MRILEINKFYHERRGAERHFLDVADALSCDGHDVAIFSMEHPKNVRSPFPTYLIGRAGFSDEDSGTVWQTMKGIGRLFWSFEARKTMKRALDAFQPDIVHIHNAYHQLSLSFLPIIGKLGIPVIMTVHDYIAISPDKDEYYENVSASYWKYLFIRKYSLPKRVLLVLRAYWDEAMGYYSRYVDVFIAPSEFVKGTLIRAGIPDEKIRVIPHFVSETGHAISVSEEERPSALYVGYVSEDKNIRLLVSLFRSIGFPLVLAGRNTTDIVDGDDIRFVGVRSKAERDELFAGASFVVNASRLPETFGLLALEAGAAGKPYIGYDTGALSEIVDEGKTGTLARTDAGFDSAIRSVIARPDMFDTAETIRRKTMERFGKRNYLDMFHAMANELLIRSNR